MLLYIKSLKLKWEEKLEGICHFFKKVIFFLVCLDEEKKTHLSHSEKILSHNKLPPTHPNGKETNFFWMGRRRLVWGGDRWSKADEGESVGKHMLIFRSLFFK